MQDEIKKYLYERFIEPTKKNRQHFVGVEIEMPIVNLDKKAVDFDVVQRITALFTERFGFVIAGHDDEGRVYSVIDNETSDTLSYDCSYNNLELSLGCAENLNTIYARFEKYYTFLQKEFKKYNYTLTGMGINPYREYNNNIPIENGRYRMLFHHLSSYDSYTLPMYFHRYPDFGLYSSASQVQIDVDYENLAQTINTFGKLEPIKSLLFSNSPLCDEFVNLYCSRDMFWENSTHGINQHNIGMFDCEFTDNNEILEYIMSCSLYCTERDGKYINFSPVPVSEYFKAEHITGEYFADGEYHSITITPELYDLEYLRTFKFEDLTFRGTIEYRSVCCQLISACMASAAFHLGIAENLNEVTELIATDKILYSHGFSKTELRKLFNAGIIPSGIDKDKLYDLVLKIVELSRKGLLKRGYGEEKYLEPLYTRIENRTNPAKKLLEHLNGGGSIEDIIKEYSIL